MRLRSKWSTNNETKKSQVFHASRKELLANESDKEIEDWDGSWWKVMKNSFQREQVETADIKPFSPAPFTFQLTLHKFLCK